MLRAVAGLAAVVFTAGLLMARLEGQEGGDLVTIDVTVVDDKGNPVTGLMASDFVVKDDGDPTAVTTFVEVSPKDSEVVRSFVLLLDDVAVPAIGTKTIQTIAHAFIDRIDRTDELSVVRLNSRDEPYGDRTEARSRVNAFAAATYPLDLSTQQFALERIAGLARQLETPDVRRKIIVCIGAPYICNVPEPGVRSVNRLSPGWNAVLAATARANAPVYAVIPGRTRMEGGGVVEFTGGLLYANRFDLGPAVDRIMRDANHYYVLGYWPHGRKRDLHSIDVKANRKDLKVHVRRRRGN